MVSTTLPCTTASSLGSLAAAAATPATRRPRLAIRRSRARGRLTDALLLPPPADHDRSLWHVAQRDWKPLPVETTQANVALRGERVDFPLENGWAGVPLLSAWQIATYPQDTTLWNKDEYIPCPVTVSIQPTRTFHSPCAGPQFPGCPAHRPTTFAPMPRQLLAYRLAERIIDVINKDEPAYKCAVTVRPEYVRLKAIQRLTQGTWGVELEIFDRS
ncbi:uncharacterized protein BXZ73DRAFT_81283 [Epithele typhae]|uniref:uncharacterized protein n=1 Tax=Epithele typhae TaxID=378194 RepID=UPI00200784EF|nr:uncharacterized protein BXZ73DRAFT_81283 [Epithele typhae]KAH9915813.1 hypothetical protein BXZ73DRAFT_81283 [Epithele typhae]